MWWLNVINDGISSNFHVWGVLLLKTYRIPISSIDVKLVRVLNLELFRLQKVVLN